MSRLHSPNIVEYVESGKSTSSDVYWIVMEILRGEDLSSILERDGPLQEGEVIKVTFNVAYSLDMLWSDIALKYIYFTEIALH